MTPTPIPDIGKFFFGFGSLDSDADSPYLLSKQASILSSTSTDSSNPRSPAISSTFGSTRGHSPLSYQGSNEPSRKLLDIPPKVLHINLAASYAQEAKPMKNSFKLDNNADIHIMKRTQPDGSAEPSAPTTLKKVLMKDVGTSCDDL